MSVFSFKKRTEYGLIMLSLLVQKERVSARDMEKVGLPRPFIVKIAQDLIEAGLVGSKEGRTGGYFLTCDPSQTTLKEVLEALEGSISTFECDNCSFESCCAHRGPIRRIVRKLGSVLEEYTLERFLQEGS